MNFNDTSKQLCFLAFIQELKHNRTLFSLQLLCLMCLYLVKPWEKGSKTVLKQVLLYCGFLH